MLGVCHGFRLTGTILKLKQDNSKRGFHNASCLAAAYQDAQPEASSALSGQARDYGCSLTSQTPGCDLPIPHLSTSADRGRYHSGPKPAAARAASLNGGCTAQTRLKANHAIDSKCAESTKDMELMQWITHLKPLVA